MAKQVLGKDPFAKTVEPQPASPRPRRQKSASRPVRQETTPQEASAEDAPGITMEIPVAPEPPQDLTAEPTQPLIVDPEPATTEETIERFTWKKWYDDGFGFDHAFEQRLKSAFDFFYQRYWRVQVKGIANIPAKGRVLLVANHAGILPYDSLVIREAVRREHPAGRLVRPLLEDFVYYAPFWGTFMSRLGSVRACQENGQQLLNREEPVLVFPEGIKGIVKHYKKRYRLQRFGRGGFVRLAMATRASIIPVAVIGSEETNPLLGNLEQVAKLVGMPYFPLTPTFPFLGLAGLLPLPSRFTVVFGKPISFEGFEPDDIHDRIKVTKVVEQVRSKLQSMIDKELTSRKNPWI